MKTIISLLVAALVVNACVRAGESAWRHYQLEDVVEQEMRFGENKTTSMLRKKVLQLATDHGVDLGPEDIQIDASRTETSVYIAYAEDIPLIPRLYTKTHAYEVSLSVQPMRPLVVDEK